MSLNTTKTNHMILKTRQRRQILNSPPAHILIGKQQLHEVSEHKLPGVTIDNNLTRGPQIRDLCKSTAKRVYQSAKIKNFPTFHARKIFFLSTHSILTMLQLFGILQVSPAEAFEIST